jgi:hypothetical protein
MKDGHVAACEKFKAMRGLDWASCPQQKIATTVTPSKQVMTRLRACFIEERNCITSKLTGAAIMNNLESREQVSRGTPLPPSRSQSAPDIHFQSGY